MVWQGVGHCWGEDAFPYGSHHSVPDNEEVLGDLLLLCVSGLGGPEEETDCSEDYCEGQVECFVVFS